jgi:GGDEF domain-containing protein
VARLGGDEFVILLAETDQDAGMLVTEKIARAVAPLHAARELARNLQHRLDQLSQSPRVGGRDDEPGRRDDVFREAKGKEFDCRARAGLRGRGI